MIDFANGAATLGVVGAGAMGQGIAQVSAAAGLQTRVLDAADGAAARAIDAIAGRFDRLVEKGRMGADEAVAAADRLRAVASIADLAGCDVVIEAVVEDSDAKQRVFRDLEHHVREDCILASNTSSIPIATIARGSARPDRIAGMHFFNPVPLMKLVEVVRAVDTGDETVAVLMALGERLGRVPVEVRDTPGFLVNLAGRAYTTEALHILDEGVATPSQMDAIMRDCCGFRMGPFELMDLTGIDVNFPVTEIIHEGFMRDPRLRTTRAHREKFEAGHLGRKTGRGWYRYADGGAVDVASPDFETSVAPAARMIVADGPGSRAAQFCDASAIAWVSDDDGTSPILFGSGLFDAASQTAAARCDPGRVVLIDLAFDTARRVTLMGSCATDPNVMAAAAAAIAARGRAVTVINDSIGFVAPRMIAMIANLGHWIVEQGLAAPGDVDRAVKLGLNYPLGPLEWGERMGLSNVVAILSQLAHADQDRRYRPTRGLQRRTLVDGVIAPANA